MKPFNPRSTTVENIVYDKIMPTLSGNAWKILCLAIRKTLGWSDPTTKSGRKESDVISISQFMVGCGIGSNNTVIEGISECLEKGYLLRTPASNRSYSYKLNLDYELSSDAETAQPISSSNAETAQPSDAEIAYTNNNINNKDIGESALERHRAQTIESLGKFYQRQEKGGIDFHWLDEGLVHFAQTFAQAVGFECAASERTLWRKALREWSEIGLTDDIIEQSIVKMRRENLTIKSPASVTAIARDMKAKANQGYDDLPPVFQASEEQMREYNQRFGIA